MLIEKLSNRLKVCADMISQGSKIVDIGTDHAYLPIFLTKNKLISKVIASDINIEPLKIARKNVRDSGLADFIEIRLSNGLENINENEVDEIVIAGMGGILISEILDRCKFKDKTSKRYILQPMTSEYDLRFYLCNNGYLIEDEKVVLSKNKVYTAMDVKYSGHKFKFSETYYYIGEILKNYNICTEMYIEKQIRDLKNRKYGSEHNNDMESVKKYDFVINNLEDIIKGKR